jgi:hypothetical protein
LYYLLNKKTESILFEKMKTVSEDEEKMYGPAPPNASDLLISPNTARKSKPGPPLSPAMKSAPKTTDSFKQTQQQKQGPPVPKFGLITKEDVRAAKAEQARFAKQLEKGVVPSTLKKRTWTILDEDVRFSAYFSDFYFCLQFRRLRGLT